MEKSVGTEFSVACKKSFPHSPKSMLSIVHDSRSCKHVSTLNDGGRGRVTFLAHVFKHTKLLKTRFFVFQESCALNYCTLSIVFQRLFSMIVAIHMLPKLKHAVACCQSLKNIKSTTWKLATRPRVIYRRYEYTSNLLYLPFVFFICEFCSSLHAPN